MVNEATYYSRHCCQGTLRLFCELDVRKVKYKCYTQSLLGIWLTHSPSGRSKVMRMYQSSPSRLCNILICIYTVYHFNASDHKCIYLIYSTVVATDVRYIPSPCQYGRVHFNDILIQAIACTTSFLYYNYFNKCVYKLTSEYT